ncbi:ABC transporter substrate-binding protein [Microbacterium sp. NPDC008134]|uniref:ABC transporter substrate-binding protein n=1 Tax=Microbacterium sp. NPDC008134 TaxID=3364183 RepID=UPI0036EE43C1
MSPLFSARPNRAVRVLGLATASAAVLALAACSAPAEGDAAGSTRVYENEFGSVELPESIERIVSVDFYTPAALIDLGVTPVGVVNSYFTDTEGEGIPLEYIDAIAESDAESIGEYYELNLEAIVKADPDVVIATQDFLPMDDPMREEIEKIAPIITFNARDGEAWRTRATELATILGKEDDLEPLVEAYDTRRDEVAAEYPEILSDYAVTVFGPEPDEWGTYSDTHFITPILRDLGATFREQAEEEVTEDGFPSWFSYEELDRIANADIIFMRTGVSDEQQAALDANTIWQNLPAVQNGMVFEYIDRGPTGSYGWAMGNLDDLEALFAEVQAKLDAQG